MVELFDFAVATIFAREVLEAALIIGEFRTIIFRAGHTLGQEEQQRLLRGIWQATIIASILAVIVCAAVAIPLAVLSISDNCSKYWEFDSTAVERIGFSCRRIHALARHGQAICDVEEGVHSRLLPLLISVENGSAMHPQPR